MWHIFLLKKDLSNLPKPVVAGYSVNFLYVLLFWMTASTSIRGTRACDPVIAVLFSLDEFFFRFFKRLCTLTKVIACVLLINPNLHTASTCFRAFHLDRHLLHAWYRLKTILVSSLNKLLLQQKSWSFFFPSWTSKLLQISVFYINVQRLHVSDGCGEECFDSETPQSLQAMEQC